MTELENLYSAIGGRFITPVAELKKRLEQIKVFVLDWDGVFNNGQKMSAGGSTFSEVDSMGLNLLRFSYFLKHKKLPLTAIISGEKNETAFYFSERECFHYSFSKIPHKSEALKFLCETEKIKPSEIAYFFDDVLDIPIAEVCGVRIQVNQKANPLFINYCQRHHLVDYLTGSPGGQFAVREGAELLTGLYGQFDEVINGRKNNSKEYQEYIGLRRAVKPEFYTLKDGRVEKLNSSGIGYR
jgi:3-deoxy-D-manno-octulosonate 8-phosphate phosphatase (KDO 8-P phosphatase)